VDDDQFAALLGRAPEAGKVQLDRNLCFRDFTHSRSPLLALIGLVVSQLVKRSEAKGTPNLNALFIYNMPLRALAKNAGQFFSMGVVDAFVREAKGWGIAGVIPALVVKLLTGRHFVLVWALWVLVPIVGAVLAHLFRSSRLKASLAKAGK
jgi:beta-glucosidase